MAEEEAAQPVWNDISNENPGPVNDKGIPHGEGVMAYPPPPPGEDEEEKPGDSYTGTLVAGVRSGRGKYTWSNGNVYEGGYQAGLKHGQGVMKFADGSKYEGIFDQGDITGEGIWTYANSDMYKGSFVSGKRNGTGAYHFAAGQCQFVGEFEENGFKSGRWVMKDGSYVRSDFTSSGQDGVWVPIGPATCKFARPGLVQEGAFEAVMRWVGGSIQAV